MRSSRRRQAKRINNHWLHESGDNYLDAHRVGDYNPDWAIAFKEGSVKHVYFVAETKGSMSLMELRPLEATKIECARKFFRKINQRYAPENVKYDVLNSFGKLMELIK